MSNNKITTTVRLDEELHRRLTAIANKEVRSVNNLIEYALVKFVREHNGEIQNAKDFIEGFRNQP